MRKNLKMYKQVNLDSGLLASDPHHIILMMFDGALTAIAEAKGAIQRKDFESKSKSLTKAINIFSALRGSLDMESQPEISGNFDLLYEYCINRLIELSVSLEIEGLNEVVNLIKPLREAWYQMPETSKQEGISLLNRKNKQNNVPISET